MLITVFTDAGYCDRIRRGSYAVWAKADGATVRQSGILKATLADANLAELHALANGLFVAVRAFKPEPGSLVIAQSDSLTAIGIMLGRIYRDRQRNPAIATPRAVLDDLKSRGVRVDFRHVSGHKGYENARSSVNTWCDRECSRYLREVREAVKETPE